MDFAPLSMASEFYHCDPWLQLHLWQVGEAPLESFGGTFQSTLVALFISYQHQESPQDGGRAGFKHQHFTCNSVI